MNKSGLLISGLVMGALISTASAEDEPRFYFGGAVTSLALDDDRTGVATRSPGHTPKIGSVVLGYQFDTNWATDLMIGTDFSGNTDADQVAINGYRFFTDNSWRPYISAGISNFGVDEALVDDSTTQVQAGFGISTYLNRNAEFRLGYQHMFETGDESYDDDAITLQFNWHFRAPEAAAVADSTPDPVPQPESVPETKEVVDTYELLVEFDFDKSEVKSIYRPQFDEIAGVLNDSSDITMTIEGHTDWIGSNEYNLALGERRAEAVKTIFVEDYSIAGSRIDTVSFGETKPVADNSSSEGRQKNRRAISVILRPRTVTE